MKEIYCQVCGEVKVAILDGSLKLRPGAKIVCEDCLPVKRNSAEDDQVVDDLRRMFGMR